MATVSLKYGEVTAIPFTIAADITGKVVVFVISRTAGGSDPAARVFRKTSASGITVTQASPTGIGTIAVAEADFGAAKLDVGNWTHSLWYEDADGSNPVETATDRVTVSGTVARTA